MEKSHNRIVVKVGTSTLTHDNGSLNIRTIDKLCKVLSDLRNQGYEVILVSSGAISVGVNKMRLSERPKELRMKQAAAAVGQCELMHIYDKELSEYGNMAAQILLTSEDFEQEDRRNNLRNTFSALLENGIIPIVNENDSVSHTEIESPKKVFGDNDTLSAIVAVMCGAAKLIILSDIEGLFDADPHKNPDAKLIHTVEKIDENIIALAGGAGTSRGTGGMATKLDAALLTTSAGCDMYITIGDNPYRIYDILDGKNVGTHFVAQK